MRHAVAHHKSYVSGTVLISAILMCLVTSPAFADDVTPIVLPGGSIPAGTGHHAQFFPSSCGWSEGCTHLGVDVWGNANDSIYPFADGLVEDIRTDGALGNAIMIRHPGIGSGGVDLYSIYLHMIAPTSLTVGTPVVAGSTRLGGVGQTGAANGINHVHFEIREFDYWYWTWTNFSPAYGNIYCRGDCSASSDIANNWEDPQNISLGAGSLIDENGGGDKYWRQNGRVYHVSSADVLTDMQTAGVPGWNWASITSVSSGEFATYMQGPAFIEASSFSNGLLVRDVGGTDVYALEDGRRRHVQSPEALNWISGDWFPHVIDIDAGIMTANVPLTADPIYGVGEGAPDGLTTTAFQNAYDSNRTSHPNCNTPGTWSGWPASFSDCLRFPKTQVASATISGASGISGWYQNFSSATLDTGTINHSTHGTYAVHGAIFTKFAELGFSGSLLGFPTSNEYDWNGKRRSDFEGGHIYWDPGPDQTYVVYTSGAPTVTTDPATSVTSSSAQLNGVANPNGSPTTGYFQYGLTTSYGSTSPAVNLGSGTSNVPFSTSTGFSCNTLYHYRAVASGNGTAYGDDRTFTTEACTSPTLQVISPNGGETLTAGTVQNVTWSPSDLDPTGRVYLYYLAPIGWEPVADFPTTTTSYNWLVPNTPTSGARIGIGNWVVDDWEAWDESDGTFTIESNCSYSLSPGSDTAPAAGSGGSFSVTAPAGCNWTPSSTDWWLEVTSGSGTGNGTITYTVHDNLNACGRAAAIHVADQTFYMTQSGNGSPPVGPVGDEFQVNTYTTSYQTAPHGTVAPNGDFVVVWESYGQDGGSTGIFGQRFAKGGAPLGGEFAVSSYTAGTQSRARVASDADGDFAVVWSNLNGSPTVSAQLFDANGTPQGPEFTVGSSGQYRPSMDMRDDGQLVVVWSAWSSGIVEGQRLNASGAPVGPVFEVSSYNNPDFSDVATDANGNFVVVWDGGASGLDIFGRRFDSNSVPLGGEFQVNSYTAGVQYGPRVAMGADGDFVVVWTSSDQDGSFDGVYAQRFSGTGAPAGGEFRVNDYTVSHQGAPAVTMDDDGNFVVAWQGVGADDSFGVSRRSFAADGTPLTGDVLVNEHTSDSQNTPDVAANGAGEFVVTWQSSYQDGCSAGVFGREFPPVSSNANAFDELAVGFTSHGLWHFDGASWTNPTPWDPLQVEAWQGKIAVGFGPSRGLWTFQPPSSWSQLTTWDPENIVAWGEALAVDFGPGRGLWLYQASVWTQLTPWDPHAMVAWGDRLAVGFDSGRGLWLYETGGWTKISGWDPLQLAVNGDTLFTGFDAGRGLWRYDTEWTQMTNWTAEKLVRWNDELAVDFGDGRGLWRHDSVGGWSLLTPWDSDLLVSWGAKLVTAFEGGRGLWSYDGSWTQLTNWQATHIAPFGQSLGIAFGGGRGLYTYDGTWAQIASWESTVLKPVDVN